MSNITNEYRKLLIEIYSKAAATNISKLKLPKDVAKNIEILASKAMNQKGVFTVLVTLCIYKFFHKDQDIRCHQTQIPGGFSGRTIDTQFITPTLKELGLPSMAESGWLTRSLEQPHPYNLDYEGKISNKEVKLAFLQILDSIQNKNISPVNVLLLLFKRVLEINKDNITAITPLENPDLLTINKLVELMSEQFSHRYQTFGGSKLPVLAFYSIYSILISELTRYKDCRLGELGSHTASDRTSRSSGDIEIFKDGELFESIEIKLDKPIDANIVRIARNKIITFNPKRYYILSNCGVMDDDKEVISSITDEVRITHGCQVVINGVLPTLKYYLRLISDLELFFNIYSNMIANDKELKQIHKTIFNDLIDKFIRNS